MTTAATAWACSAERTCSLPGTTIRPSRAATDVVTAGASVACPAARQAGLGVEEFLGGVDLAVAGAQHARPVRAAQMLRRVQGLGRGEHDRAIRGQGGGPLGHGDAVGRGGEPDPVQLPVRLGEQVGPGERGPLVRDLHHHQRGGVGEDPVLQVVRR